MLRSVAFAFLVIAFSCYGNVVSKEGFVTVDVPHEHCVNKCISAELHKEQTLISSHQINQDGSNFAGTISYSGLSDGRYTVRFFGPKATDKPLAVKVFDVDHYSLSTALKVFTLGLAMFAVLLWVLFQHVRQEQQK